MFPSIFFFFFYCFVLLQFSDVFFSQRILSGGRTFCVFAPESGTKNTFLKNATRREEKRLRLIFFIVSLPVFFFSICFQGLFCVYSTFHSHPLQQSLPFSKLPWNPSTRSPRRLKTNHACSGKKKNKKKKTFHELTIAFKSGDEAPPFQWLTYSNHSFCQTTGTVRKASVSY